MKHPFGLPGPGKPQAFPCVRTAQLAVNAKFRQSFEISPFLTRKSGARCGAGQEQNVCEFNEIRGGSKVYQ